VILAVALWYGAVLLFQVPPYLLPLPHVVVQRIGEDFDFLLKHSVFTTSITLGGFLLSVAVGIPLAFLIVSSTVIDKAIMPWLILSQTFPKVALAPLIVVWFGLGVVPKLLVTFLVAFFPIVIATVIGLRSMERDMVELAQSMRSSRLQTFWYFRLPLALPSVFGGLKVSVAFAVVGAVIAEWVGASRGLGYLLLTANASLDTALLFAVLVILMIIGVVLYYGIEALERVVVPWHATVRLRDLAAAT
jgi:NitT/TauT family transport system permease protein